MRDQGSNIEAVDLKDVMFNILYKWREILVVAFVVAILFGGIKTANGIANIVNFEKDEEMQMQYNKEIELYETNKETYESEIENISQELESLNQYLQKSVLMQISPYNKPVASADIYIKTDFKIMPDMVFQNVDYTDSIIEAYVRGIKQNGLTDDWQDIMPEMDADYISELITFRANYDNNTFHIDVMHTDLNAAENALDRIIKNITNYSDNLTSKIGDHQVIVLNKGTSYDVDTELAKIHDNNYNTRSTLQKYLSDKSVQLDELKEPVYKGGTKFTILKSGIKYGVFGGIIGGFMVAGIALLNILMNDKLFSAKEIRYCHNIPVLGVSKKEHKNKLFWRIDCWLDRLYQGNAEVESSKLYQVAAANISTYAKDAKQLILVGAGGEDLIRETLDSLSQVLEHKKVVYGGNVKQDAGAIQTISEIDGIILVEKRGVSSREDVLRVIDIAEVTGKMIVGCILF